MIVIIYLFFSFLVVIAADGVLKVGLVPFFKFISTFEVHNGCICFGLLVPAHDTS